MGLFYNVFIAAFSSIGAFLFGYIYFLIQVYSFSDISGWSSDMIGIRCLTMHET